MFAALVSKPGFLKRNPCPPLEVTEAVLCGPRAEGEQGLRAKAEVKTRHFY